jgi:hypothetical protein
MAIQTPIFRVVERYTCVRKREMALRVTPLHDVVQNKAQERMKTLHLERKNGGWTI